MQVSQAFSLIIMGVFFLMATSGKEKRSIKNKVMIGLLYMLGVFSILNVNIISLFSNLFN